VGGRLGRTFAAHGLIQIANFLSVILTVPLLITAWGLPVYTDWLLIVALPSFFSLADFGFGQAVASEVGKLWAAGELEEANKIYQTGLTIIFFSCLICALIFIPVVQVIPVQKILRVTAISPDLTRTLSIIFAMQVLLAQLVGVLRAAFRTQGLESLSVAITSLNGIGSLISVVITWLFHGTPLTLACMMFGFSVLVISLIYIEGRRRVTWLKTRFCRITKESVKPILAPGIGMNLINLAQGLSLQGTFLAVSYAINPQAAAIFNSTRTLTRSVNQLANMVTYTFYSEFSTSIGASNFDLAKRLHHRSSQVSFWLSLFASLCLAVVGRPIFLTWTKHKMPFNVPLFSLLLLSLVITALYSGSIAAPMAVNKHLKMSIYYCFASVVSVGVCWAACRFMGLAGGGIGTLALAVIMLIIIVPIAINIVHDNFGEWISATFNPNFNWLIHRLKRKKAA
jgi:O-antigen/teichoic acid export membrane protein